MAETRRHYPAGETGDKQFAYELSLLTTEEQGKVVHDSLQEEVARFKGYCESIVVAGAQACATRLLRSMRASRER